jgi:hypothetical protein
MMFFGWHSAPPNVWLMRARQRAIPAASVRSSGCECLNRENTLLLVQGDRTIMILDASANASYGRSFGHFIGSQRREKKP